ncbi:MAG: hypothetical protein HZA25_01690 [Candidatus Niyogibacteria bacterium]|nr:hypothetical protein [Candidatus Niyogibacteria bacterium]
MRFSTDYGYFAFNLHYVSLFNLIRLEESPRVQDEYRRVLKSRLRELTKDDKNALFDLFYAIAVERDERVVAEAVRSLRDFPAAPRRNYRVENSGRADLQKRRSWIGVLMLEQETLFAAGPLPIGERPPTDFLWQRPPGVLDGGGDGALEYPGVDFLLPYWLGRYYGLIGAND